MRWREARAQRAGRTIAVAVKIAARLAARSGCASFPATGLLGCVKRAHQAHRAERGFGVGGGAVAHRVDAPDLERVEPEPLRADVEMALGRKRRLQGTEGAERAGWRVVGVDAIGVDLDVWNHVRPSREDC